MPLTSYGLREWLTIVIVALLLSAAAAWFGLWWLVAIVVIIALALLSFFRDPIRRVPTDLPPGTMLSPADGTVSKIFRVDHHDAVGGPAQVIRIFLSVLDVHINRAPFDGVVESIVHTPGRYLDARTEESAKVNESNLITMTVQIPPSTAAASSSPAAPNPHPRSERIGIRQVSGAIARRIVCPIQVGTRLTRGQRFGMIKFGSTTELILPRPDDVDIRVSLGTKVVGGRTVVAVLAPFVSS